MRLSATKFRLSAAVTGFFALLLAIGAVFALGPDRAGAQQVVNVTLGPGAGPAGGGNQTGTAKLTAMGSQTEVVLSILPGPAGVEQPAHIHSGTCAALGAVVYPLNNVVNGASTTTVNAALASLQNGNFAINAHESGANIGVYVSCGDIPAAAQTTPTPSPSPTASPNAGGQPSATVNVGDLWFCPAGNTACQTIVANDIDSVVNIPTGGTVAWNWVGKAPHTVTACSGSGFTNCNAAQGFESGQKTSGTFSQSFTQAGTFYYQCVIHPNQMRGQINVGASVIPSGGGAPGSSGDSFPYELLALGIGGAVVLGAGALALRARRG